MSNTTSHAKFPDWVWVMVEQPRHEARRMKYRPESGTFEATADRALSYARHFPGHYGWIVGFGQPPGNHFDIYVVDDSPARPGDQFEAAIIGLFVRSDGDHKFVAMTDVRPGAQPDLLSLPAGQKNSILALYPVLTGEDRWAGRDEARQWLLTRTPEHD